MCQHILSKIVQSKLRDMSFMCVWKKNIVTASARTGCHYCFEVSLYIFMVTGSLHDPLTVSQFQELRVKILTVSLTKVQLCEWKPNFGSFCCGFSSIDGILDVKDVMIRLYKFFSSKKLFVKRSVPAFMLCFLLNWPPRWIFNGWKSRAQWVTLMLVRISAWKYVNHLFPAACLY